MSGLHDAKGFSGEVRTEQGRVIQLANVAVLKFSKIGEATQYMDTPNQEVGNRSPREVAAESVEGLIKVLGHLGKMEYKNG